MSEELLNEIDPKPTDRLGSPAAAIKPKRSVLGEALIISRLKGDGDASVPEQIQEE